MAVVVGSFVSTPSNKSFSQLKTDVARYVMLPNNAEALTVAGDGLNDSIRRLNTRQWGWNKTTQDITLVASTITYTLAAAFRAPMHAELLNSSSTPEGRLHWYHPKEFASAFQDRSTDGNPSAYTCFNVNDNGKIELNVPPSSTYVTTYPTVRLRYYASLNYFSGDSDTLSGPSEVEHFMLWSAKSYIASVYDPQKYSIAKRESLEAWRLLIEQHHEQYETDWPED